MAERPAVDAFWPPELADRADGLDERPFGPEGIRLRVPRLSPGAVREIAADLRAARRSGLADRPVREVLERVASAAGRLARPGDPIRDELIELLPALTGYSARMVEHGLARMAPSWTAAALGRALEGELGDPAVLDGFRPRGGGDLQRAYGPALAVHIFSGNIPGVSVSSLIRALIVKAASLGKTASGEPYMAVAFARALAGTDPELARCIAVTHWPGGDRDLEDAAFGEADAVIAYGADDTIRDLRGRIPVRARLIAYPNRVGAAIVTRDALSDLATADDLARGVAIDVVTFDQQGCVSPHLVYVERGGAIEPAEFAERVALQLDALGSEMPRRSLSPAESSRIHQLRGQAEMRGATVLASESGTDWTVIVEAGRGFEPSPLNRVLHIRPVSEVGEAIAALEPIGARLQTIALAAAPDALEELAGSLGALGATRIVPVGGASWPSPDWHHDGRFQFLDLVRFVDVEVG